MCFLTRHFRTRDCTGALRPHQSYLKLDLSKSIFVVLEDLLTFKFKLIAILMRLQSYAKYLMLIL